jgi:nucleotide-binding universal stress UspA family protein
MKLILVPTDFSENATHALEYAVETAHVINAGLLVIYVYNPPVSFQSALQSVAAEDVDRATRIAREKLNAIVNTVQEEFPGVSCQYEIGIGDVVGEILALAKKRNTNLIIMGTQGASKMVNVLFGSNTAAIIEKADCPVLCIPQNLTFKTPEKILFATNFSYNDIEGARQLVQLAHGFGSSVIFGHVVVGAEETDEERAVVEKFAHEIRLLTNYDKISSKVISDANLNLGLDALIEKSGVDMIALATRRRGLFEKFYNPSITKKFSYYTKIPLLAFHNPKDEEKTGRDFHA